MKELQMKEGTEKLTDRIIRIRRRPIIISVFGIPDSGKTFLIENTGRHFEACGWKVKQRTNQEHINEYESWAGSPNYSIRQISQQIEGFDLVMYHCPWDNRLHPWSDREDPEASLQRGLNKPLDIVVAVYNPQRSCIPKGEFDLIIVNPDSSEKPTNYDD